jgi:hypothetical protein
MRIARNDTVQTIWLKFSDMLQFIRSSIVLIVKGRRGQCRQETSAKCQDLQAWLRLRAPHLTDHGVEARGPTQDQLDGCVRLKPPGDALVRGSSPLDSGFPICFSLVKRRRNCAALSSRHDPRRYASSCSLIVSTHHVHGFPLSGTFFVRRFPRNSWATLAPARPAMPMKALVKTRFAPRSAWG